MNVFDKSSLLESSTQFNKKRAINQNIPYERPQTARHLSRDDANAPTLLCYRHIDPSFSNGILLNKMKYEKAAKRREVIEKQRSQSRERNMHKKTIKI
jgi:hypothetical protein